MSRPIDLALKAIEHESWVSLEYSEDGGLLVEGSRLPLPTETLKNSRYRLKGERKELLGIEGLLPNVPHGDDRDKLLWRVVADASPEIVDGELLADADLFENLEERLDLPTESASAVASALKGRFFNRSSRLLPVHASLPLNYRHTRRNKKKGLVPTSYTMYGGGILPFMLWNSASGGPNTELIQQLLDAIASDEGLNSLDKKFLSIALQGAPRQDAQPSAHHLVRRTAGDYTGDFKKRGLPFCEPSMALFERDLATVLTTELPRPERARWLTLLLSLHLCLRHYRIAVAIGSELDIAISAAAQIQPPEDARVCKCRSRDIMQLHDCALAGAIKFRMGTGRYRKSSESDASRRAFTRLDRHRLLDMPASLITRSLALRAWEALSPSRPEESRELADLASALQADADLRRTHGAACAAIAILHHESSKNGESTLYELSAAGRVGESRPGLHALREEVRSSRRANLRRQSTDVVNQLMLKDNVGSGSLIARNGPSFSFFEIDEELLLLLVRLICQDREVPIDAFLHELEAYGLAPQDVDEKENLAETLERLGLLERYSDAGEASFVYYS